MDTKLEVGWGGGGEAIGIVVFEYDQNTFYTYLIVKI